MKPKIERLSFVVSEMKSGVPDSVKVPLAKGVELKTLTEGDKNPMFVTLEALVEGESKNGRYYDRETIVSVAEQINQLKPDGYEGHLKDEDRAFKSPQAKTIWVGAKVYEIDDKAHLFVKGYVLPYAKELKTYLRAAKAAAKRVSVSIYGTAKTVFDRVKNVKKIIDFQLESLDWARSGSAGIQTLGYLSIAREMKDDEPDSRTILEMFESVRSEVAEKLKGEFSGNTSQELETIREMVGDGEVVEVVREMKARLESLEREVAVSEVNRLLREKISSLTTRKLLHTLIVAETKNTLFTKEAAKSIVERVLTSDNGRLIIRETAGKEIAPRYDNSAKQKRRFTKI
jgi:hypothetical protein